MARCHGEGQLLIMLILGRWYWTTFLQVSRAKRRGQLSSAGGQTSWVQAGVSGPLPWRPWADVMCIHLEGWTGHSVLRMVMRAFRSE